MAGFKTFEVNGRKYTVLPMAPDQVLSYGFKVGQIIAPILSTLGQTATEKDGEASIKALSMAFATSDAEKLTAICRTALSYTVNPENEKFDNIAVYNAWFNKYPEDMFMVSVYAVWRLVEDFFPKFSGMMVPTP